MANLRVAELDFDEIKANLKEFLSSQSEFSDYDFEGSALSVLIDLLAYNTHYNAYFANMVINEMFLDSAVKRASAVSLARHLGYMPRSARGAKGVVEVSVTGVAGTPSYLTIPKYSTFTSSVNGSSYTFLTIDDHTTEPVGGVYTFSDVDVVQGTLLSFEFTVQEPGPAEKYIIPNNDVDTTTLTVVVQNSSTDNTTVTYTRADTIYSLDSTSKVYFLEETNQGLHQLYFGDNILGKKLEAGNIVRVFYMVVDGTAANVSNLLDQQFSFTGTLGGQVPTVTTVSNSTGGADKESIDSIKFNAVRFNSAKGRLVNKNDYSTYIKSNYSQIQAVSVWGGDENNPPVYGKVFISLKPFEGYTVDSVLTNDIKSTLLKERQVLTVSPVFVQPDILFVRMNGQVKYNKTLTVKTPTTVANEVKEAIGSYFTNNLQTFERDFYYSDFLNTIKTDSSIESISLEPSIQKRIVPVLNVENSYISDNTIKFYNRIHPNEVYSSRFFIQSGGVETPVRIRDVPGSSPPDYNGTGTLQLYNDVNDTVVNTNIGTVNYLTGELSITGIIPIGYYQGTFDIRINAGLQSPFYDITSQKNVLIFLDDSQDVPSAGFSPGVSITAIAI